jgi:transposase, IS5 family
MIKTSPFADQEREAKLNKPGDALRVLEQHVDFAALTAEVDTAASCPSRERGGRPSPPTELMVRVLLTQQLVNLSDEQMEFQLLDRLSFQRFVGLRASSQFPVQTTTRPSTSASSRPVPARAFSKWSTPSFPGTATLHAACQIVNASIVQAPKQSLSKEEKALVGEGALLADWRPAQRRQKDVDSRWTKKHGNSYSGYKVSANADKRYKLAGDLRGDVTRPGISAWCRTALLPCQERTSIDLGRKPDAWRDRAA